MEIRAKEEFWATQPIESPYWHSISGEEYQYVMDAEYVVLNQNFGPHRLRYVCKIIGTFKVHSQKYNDYLYREVVRRGIANLI